MIRLLIFFGFIVFAMLGTLIQAESDRPNDGLPMVKSDYQVCARVDPGPLRPPKRDVFKPAVSELS